MRINRLCVVLALCCWLCNLFAQLKPVSLEYRFDKNGISREALERYLEKSITMVYFLTPDTPEGRRVYPYPDDDVRMVKNIGAKFIGRAIYRWGGESRLNDPSFLATAAAKNQVDTRIQIGRAHV